MEAAVGAEGVAFAREHAGGILVLPLESEHAGGERKEAGEVLSHAPFQNLAVILESGERDLRQSGSRKGSRIEPGADFLFSHPDHVLVARVDLLRFRPVLDELPGARIELGVFLLDQRIQHPGILARRGEHRFRRKQLLPLARYSRLLASTGVVAAHRVRDLGKVAAARGRDDRVSRGGRARLGRVKRARSCFQTVLDKRGQDALVERGNAVVVEARGDGAVYRHVPGGAVEELAVALVLLPHVPQRVLAALAVELVDGDEIGEIAHVDFLELARRAVFGRHHVERGIGERHDRRIALTDAGSLDEHQIESGDLACRDHVREALRHFAFSVARGERAHEHAPSGDRVHADAVAEQRPAGFPPRGIDRENGDAEPVFLVEAEAAHELIGERGFSRPARTGYAERRHGKRMGLLQHLPAQFFRGAELKGSDEPRQRPAVAGFYCLEVLRRVLRQVLVAALEHVVDHALQAHLLTVLGRVNARDAVGLKLADLVCDDHAAAAAEHLDVLPAAAAQQVDHVLEVLDVAALVRGDRDALHVFLQRGRNDFVDRAVVAEMDHFGAARLQDAAHDVDGRVVAVEKRGRRHETDLVLGLVFGVPGGTQIGHGCLYASGPGENERLLYVYVNVKIVPRGAYSTVTDLARFLGLSTSLPRSSAAW